MQAYWLLLCPIFTPSLVASATNLFLVEFSISHLLHPLYDAYCLTVSVESRRLDASIIMITNAFYGVRPSTSRCKRNQSAIV